MGVLFFYEPFQRVYTQFK